MFFSVCCTVYLPVVTSSTLVRSELMRLIVLPQRWLHLRTGGCVGRGTYIIYAWTTPAIHKRKRRPGPIQYMTVSVIPPLPGEPSFSTLPLSYSCPRDPSLLLDLPPPLPLHQAPSFSIPSKPWLSWQELLGWLDKPVPTKLLAKTLPTPSIWVLLS